MQIETNPTDLAPAAPLPERPVSEVFRIIFDDLARPEVVNVGPNVKAIVTLAALVRESEEATTAKKRDYKLILEIAARLEAWDKGPAASLTIPAVQIAHLQAIKVRALKKIYFAAADELRITPIEE